MPDYGRAGYPAQLYADLRQYDPVQKNRHHYEVREIEKHGECAVSPNPHHMTPKRDLSLGEILFRSL